ncbi:hypothetical protein UFOVP119_6 [uncultured Caudovirales phage]|uniref:Uncharacterized protein n=1 Tax=uncultured Caudovirales phage TaxID=2100421 RepID=A0A6J5LAF3_9CAUD|nr:hypothetical protein UFOVP119_6 [uncultured Caudovirales phage]
MMRVDQALAICEEWLAYLNMQREKSVAVQRCAIQARTDPDGARRALAQIDRKPLVYDGGRLEPAVRALMELAKGESVRRMTIAEVAKYVEGLDNTMMMPQSKCAAAIRSLASRR